MNSENFDDPSDLSKCLLVECLAKSRHRWTNYNFQIINDENAPAEIQQDELIKLTTEKDLTELGKANLTIGPHIFTDVTFYSRRLKPDATKLPKPPRQPKQKIVRQSKEKPSIKDKKGSKSPKMPKPLKEKLPKPIKVPNPLIEPKSQKSSPPQKKVSVPKAPRKEKPKKPAPEPPPPEAKNPFAYPVHSPFHPFGYPHPFYHTYGPPPVYMPETPSSRPQSLVPQLPTSFTIPLSSSGPNSTIASHSPDAVATVNETDKPHPNTTTVIENNPNAHLNPDVGLIRSQSPNSHLSRVVPPSHLQPPTSMFPFPLLYPPKEFGSHINPLQNPSNLNIPSSDANNKYLVDKDEVCTQKSTKTDNIGLECDEKADEQITTTAPAESNTDENDDKLSTATSTRSNALQQTPMKTAISTKPSSDISKHMPPNLMYPPGQFPPGAIPYFQRPPLPPPQTPSALNMSTDSNSAIDGSQLSSLKQSPFPMPPPFYGNFPPGTTPPMYFSFPMYPGHMIGRPCSTPAKKERSKKPNKKAFSSDVEASGDTGATKKRKRRSSTATKKVPDEDTAKNDMEEKDQKEVTIEKVSVTDPPSLEVIETECEKEKEDIANLSQAQTEKNQDEEENIETRTQNGEDIAIGKELNESIIVEIDDDYYRDQDDEISSKANNNWETHQDGEDKETPEEGSCQDAVEISDSEREINANFCESENVENLEETVVENPEEEHEPAEYEEVDKEGEEADYDLQDESEESVRAQFDVDSEEMEKEEREESNELEQDISYTDQVINKEEGNKAEKVEDQEVDHDVKEEDAALKDDIGILMINSKEIRTQEKSDCYAEMKKLEEDQQSEKNNENKEEIVVKTEDMKEEPSASTKKISKHRRRKFDLVFEFEENKGIKFKWPYDSMVVLKESELNEDRSVFELDCCIILPEYDKRVKNKMQEAIFLTIQTSVLTLKDAFLEYANELTLERLVEKASQFPSEHMHLDYEKPVTLDDCDTLLEPLESTARYEKRTRQRKKRKVFGNEVIRMKPSTLENPSISIVIDNSNLNLKMKLDSDFEADSENRLGSDVQLVEGVIVEQVIESGYVEDIHEIAYDKDGDAAHIYVSSELNDDLNDVAPMETI